ncbi:hypothetical protein SAMN05421796_102198 [Chryseobacterium piscicola]|jgi:hypothetical protein|uniref:DUF2147 domain-containing protein n=1 Tax=Chryseobacterium piscicola TaxID=551459 RepID=A0A1N7LCD9_9FLAO|nr:hypothetical protein [Chryseobacterium piscicola]PQA97515.1 hypothetical protein B0A70_02310 [Chryseobacterium piscicola]SIS71413.1 hypothetical protein SAMN05421796_102198 [Chryseobacterium piscicola]
MKKILFLFLFCSALGFAQMPDISKVWLNESKPYEGTIGKNGEVLKLKINISEQDKEKDQEYFVSGYSLVDKVYAKFEGKIKITKYKNSGKRGNVYGEYEFAEEDKGKHSGMLKGKFIYTFGWNKDENKIENQYIQMIGDWFSYDKSMNFKTKLKN